MLRGLDSNQRPSAYETDELPTATTPQFKIQPETTASMLGLLSDYIFPSCPPTFDWYPNNAGDLSAPLFESLFLDYSPSTYSIQPCRAN